MKVAHFAVASVLLAVVGGLFYYDRVATERRESDTSDDRSLVVEGASFDDVREFEFIASATEEDEETGAKNSSDGSASPLIVRGVWSPATDPSAETKDGVAAVSTSEKQDEKVAESESGADDEGSDEEDSAGADDGEADDEGSWNITYPLSFPADTQELRAFVEGFLNYRYDETFEVPQERLESFGLTEGAASLTLKIPGFAHPSLTYKVGKSAPVGFKMYLALSTQPQHVFYGPRSSVLMQKKPLEEFLDLSLPSMTLQAGQKLDVQIFTDSTGKPAQHFTFMLAHPNTASAEESDVSREDLRLSLVTHPDLKERPSMAAVDDLIDILSDVKPKTLVSEEMKSDILAAGQKLQVRTLEVATDAAHSASALEIYRWQKGSGSAEKGESAQENGSGQPYYVMKNGELFSFEKKELGGYFAAKLDDFLEKNLPLSVEKKDLATVKITSHEYENGDHKTYSLKQGLWSVDDSASSSEAQTEQKPSEVGKAQPVVWDDSPLLKDEISGFISELYNINYLRHSPQKPQSPHVLLYSVVLQGTEASQKDQTWQIYSSFNDYSETWLHVPGTQRYYLTADSLIGQLEAPSKSEQEALEATADEPGHLQGGPDLENLEIKPQVVLPDSHPADEGGP